MLSQANYLDYDKEGDMERERMIINKYEFPLLDSDCKMQRKKRLDFPLPTYASLQTSFTV